jgi:hypothetical protein
MANHCAIPPTEEARIDTPRKDNKKRSAGIGITFSVGGRKGPARRIGAPRLLASGRRRRRFRGRPRPNPRQGSGARRRVRGDRGNGGWRKLGIGGVLGDSSARWLCTLRWSWFPRRPLLFPIESSSSRRGLKSSQSHSTGRVVFSLLISTANLQLRPSETA